VPSPRINREVLKGPRLDVRSRTLETWRGPRHPIVIEQVVVDGILLNVPESLIYQALERLRLEFTAQPSLGLGNALGGARPDFILHEYNMVLGFHGPWHFTFEGKVRDFWREVMYQAFGLTSVFLVDEDLRDEHGQYSIGSTMRRIMEVIGSPLTSSLMTRFRR